MGQKRKLPFGYRMVLGEIVTVDAEAELVRQIFQRYVQGLSYKELVDQLKNQDIAYDHGRVWNKNMVARILEDARYTGEKDFPGILPPSLYQAVQNKRVQRAAPIQRTEAQKALRQLSGERATEEVEKYVLDLLNHLIGHPEMIQGPEKVVTGSAKAAELSLDLEAALDRHPMDEDLVRRLILDLAAAEYEAIDSRVYETERLRRIIAKAAPMGTLDADLLRTAVSRIKIDRKTITLYLKNGQAVEGRRI